MRENVIEGYLRDKVREAGGKAYKFVSPGQAGVPDRLIVFPGGGLFFRELKAPGGKPTALQVKQLNYLASMGFNVGIIDSKEKVDDFIREATGK